MTASSLSLSRAGSCSSSARISSTGVSPLVFVGDAASEGVVLGDDATAADVVVLGDDDVGAAFEVSL